MAEAESKTPAAPPKSEELTIAALRARAKEHGVKGSVSSMSKATLEYAIEAASIHRIQLHWTEARVDNEIRRITQMHGVSQLMDTKRKGFFTRAEFDLVRSCLHPDSRLSVSDEKLAKAFAIISAAEILFLSREDLQVRLKGRGE